MVPAEELADSYGGDSETGTYSGKGALEYKVEATTLATSVGDFFARARASAFFFADANFFFADANARARF